MTDSMPAQRVQRIDASQHYGHEACRSSASPIRRAGLITRVCRQARTNLQPKMHVFQMFWGIDKIARRDVNRATNVCLVSLTTRNFGVPLMKLNVALAAAIAALAIAGCAKKEAEAPAADTAAPAADATAPASDAAADAATDAAAAPADPAAAPADPAAAPADGTAAPAEEAPKQ
ncbi:MAG TPA: hypothetical protein VF033_15285 [Steroidobacteraceae bacterium]